MLAIFLFSWRKCRWSECWIFRRKKNMHFICCAFCWETYHKFYLIDSIYYLHFFQPLLTFFYASKNIVFFPSGRAFGGIHLRLSRVNNCREGGNERVREWRKQTIYGTAEVNHFLLNEFCIMLWMVASLLRITASSTWSEPSPAEPSSLQ